MNSILMSHTSMYWCYCEYYYLPSRNYFLSVKKVVTSVNVVLLFPSSVVLLVHFWLFCWGFSYLEAVASYWCSLWFLIMHLIVDRRSFLTFSDFAFWFQHESYVHDLANALIENETLTAEDIKHILNPSPKKQRAEEQEEGLAVC